MSYAKKGSLRKRLSDIVKFKWQDRLQLLKNIVSGLKVIHESNLAHGDFHDGNILISDNYNEVFIIDLGLCKPISDLQDSDNEIYGVLPYMAPEILRSNPYTQASDIYSFSMIMWEFTSGIPPFNHEAHDHDLILSICNGERPKIMKSTPNCYIDLNEKCWDSNPSNRPTIMMLVNTISEWIECINEYYRLNRNGNYQFRVHAINNQLTNDMFELVVADKTSVQEQVNTSIMQSHLQANTSIMQSHSQVYYTSRKLTEILVQEYSVQEESTQGYDCAIED
ncbi:kinase-like domain-containing protein [Rhizophagus irregularis DAOM 181602=DAOM 197198]|nr:kinase-like domain-containing protein [Rhizophagus irregularis DAOM 181602=DAOM 197198]POG70948.1 kinase-like domain-containing protein [Rhizophagus irregularis DAOM 181602=DAOM 197198]|eukprot:XP_025177814.1 kinase-like domain-containing protein [Rhizophagus irregularis DAOM 181602=DAOM 197198]